MSKNFDKTKFFGDWSGMKDEIKLIVRLGQADEALKHVPSNAQFVSVVVGAKVTDPTQLGTFKQPMRPDFIAGQHGISDRVDVGYLCHDGTNLRFLSPEKEIFSMPLSDIRDVTLRLLGSDDWGLIITFSGATYIFGQFAKILLIQGSAWHTLHTVFNDPTGGWYKELDKLGAVPKKRKKQWSISNLIILAVVVLGLAITIWFIFVKK
jgi:hypothetical protein